MTDLVAAWYVWLSQWSQGPILVIQRWIDVMDLPVGSALLFGVIGATSPCQLTTNLGALSFSASQPGRAGALRAALLYVLGKVSVYSVVGGIVILLGVQLQAVSIPVVVLARQLLGPLMIVVGLGMLGVIRLPAGIGRCLSRKVRERLLDGSRRNAFLLGVAFSFAFCPTLFWLFFGLTLPLALRTDGGWSFPAVFAVGTALPLLALATGVSLGLSAGERLAGGMSRWHRWIASAAGFLLMLAGLHDTLVYWWL